ncbi:MAG: hypothetical protein ACI9CD_001294, partial [Candidatus Deianiraeaceae bacterium]
MSSIARVYNILIEKIQSPFWLTYFVWWLAFNYDFILILFGFEDTTYRIKTYYHYPQCGEEFCPSSLYAIVFYFNNVSLLQYLYPPFHFILYDICIPLILTTFTIKYFYPKIVNILCESYHSSQTTHQYSKKTIIRDLEEKEMEMATEREKRYLEDQAPQEYIED